ncbi:AMP-binding protein [Acidocella aromatica]|uniref:Acyl-coenzyme A synthetase/AMP-(Fatty) acid ligase n=1 Tax=Acidocella aromatica TaxID=1303579 RepID=A0A840VDZ5_9PROT|nr:AMP-binding protein [Acidocella aromatica]MBB5373926.1 acyl-coenzyme A synthetase/AMP-(fatty) acid ligase [Acidocella aromatica]
MNTPTAHVYSVTCHAAGDVIARRGGQTLDAAQFHRDAASLAALLPERRYIINLCTDRYHFMVGFAAALMRGQTSLMPTANVPEALRALAEDYPDLYALTDVGDAAVPSFAYPADLSGAASALPAIPGAQPASIQFTSGSTGKPKPVPKSWSVLVHSARTAGARLDAPALRGATIIGTVPHQHSYGLESIVLLALQHGFAVEASSPLYPADVRDALERTPRPRILVTTPVHLRALVAEPEGMPPVDLILSATAPLPEPLAHAAEACFGAPLVEIYGCTEAGQAASRRTTQETDWHLFDGIELRQDGTGNWASGAPVEGIAPLQDVIELTGPRHFRLGARAAELVNIVGKRSSLPYLNSQLLSIPGVQDGTFLLDDTTPLPVQRLMAVAVAPTLTQEAILHALRERIDPTFLPRPLAVVKSLPRNAMGKLPRADLLRLLGRAP